MMRDKASCQSCCKVGLTTTWEGGKGVISSDLNVYAAASERQRARNTVSACCKSLLLQQALTTQDNRSVLMWAGTGLENRCLSAPWY
jgi:hypothetical protein